MSPGTFVLSTGPIIDKNCSLCPPKYDFISFNSSLKFKLHLKDITVIEKGFQEANKELHFDKFL